MAWHHAEYRASHGEATPGFWLNFQLRWDLYHAQKDEADALKKIRRRPRPAPWTSAV